MYADYDGKMIGWVGSTANESLFADYKLLTELADAKSEYLEYVPRAILNGFIAEQETSAAFDNGEYDHGSLNCSQDTTDSTVGGSESDTQQPSSTSSVALLTRDARKLPRAGCSVCGKEGCDNECLDGFLKSRPQLSAGRTTDVVADTRNRGQKLCKERPSNKKYFPHAGYEPPQYMCTKCYIDVCGPVCKNRTSASKMSAVAISDLLPLSPEVKASDMARHAPDSSANLEHPPLKYKVLH
jgi:hypothetical protein